MSSRRTKNAKRANNAAAAALLDEHFREAGLEGTAPPTASLKALSKVISSGNSTSIARILAGSTKYVKGRASKAPVPFSSSSSSVLASAFEPVIEDALNKQKSKRSRMSRIKINFMKTKKAPTYRVNALRAALPRPHQTKCMTECAIACMVKEKEKPFVRTLPPVAPPPSPVSAMPSSTQELRELFSSMPPPPPVRQRLRKMSEMPQKPYYHQLTKTKPYHQMLSRKTRKRGIRAKTINYNFS
jgi:hypothetical protein